MPKRSATSLPFTPKTIAGGNYYVGRDNSDVNVIVLHTIVGSASSAIARFSNPASKLSAHYIVGLDGTIYQCVDESNTAYANGNWQINLRAISIEHEDNGNYNDTVRTDAQYDKSAQLVADICTFYNIPIDRQHVIRHQEVPYPTACPDGLDVDRIVARAQMYAQEKSAQNVPNQPQSTPGTLTVTLPQGLNVRNQPSTVGGIIRAVTNGTTLTYVNLVAGQAVQGNNGWYKLDDNNYIWSGGVTVTKPAVIQQQNPPKPGEPGSPEFDQNRAIQVLKSFVANHGGNLEGAAIELTTFYISQHQNASNTPQGGGTTGS